MEASASCHSDCQAAQHEQAAWGARCSTGLAAWLPLQRERPGSTRLLVPAAVLPHSSTLALRPDSSYLRRTTCCKMPSAWSLSLRQHAPQTRARWVCVLLPCTAATYFSVDVIFQSVIFSCHVLPCSCQMKS